MTILVNTKNLNKKVKISLQEAKKAAEVTLKKVGKKNAEVNLVFISNQKIRALNRKYLNIDTSTDVIAFGTGDENIPGEKKSNFLGDIAISTDKAKQNSKVYNTSFTEEVLLYVIHGVLHLVGYDDTTKAKREIMRGKENELLQGIRKGS